MLERGGLRLRIYSTTNSNYIADEFINSINKRAKQLLKEEGVYIKLLPKPMLGGGVELSLIIKLVSYFISSIRITVDTLKRRAERITAYSAPTFRIYIIEDFNTPSDYYVTSFDQCVGNQVKSLVFHGYSLAKKLSEIYPDYQFELNATCSYGKFKYQLHVNLRADVMDKASVGRLIKVTSDIRLKSFCDETVDYTRGFLIRQRLNYKDRGERLIRTKTLYYFKFDRLCKLSLHQRNLRQTKNSKGILLKPLP